MQFQLSSIYQSKTSALSCPKGPIKSNIQKIFNSTANSNLTSNFDQTAIDENENLKKYQVKDYNVQKTVIPDIQNVDENNFQNDKDEHQVSDACNCICSKKNFDDEYNYLLMMEYTPNVKILPPVSSHSFPSSFLFRINMCTRRCNMNDSKVVNQKALFLDEIGDILHQNDFQTISSVFPREINLKRKLLHMIYINICATKKSQASFHLSNIYSYMYSDKYEDRSFIQMNNPSFMKYFFKILNGMIKVIKISDLKIILKICEDLLLDENDQIMHFFTNFIIFHQQQSMELFNMFSDILCNYTKSPPYLKKIILPLLKILSDNLMITNRVKTSKTVLKIIVPLIRDAHFQFYSGEFIKLINYISEDFSNVYKFILIYILKYFPQTNTKKQVILLRMLIKCLSNINSKDFKNEDYKVMNSVVKLLSNCIKSPSSIVSQASFRFFYEKTVNNFLSLNKKIIADNLLPAVSDSLHHHWSEKVKKDASFAMSILKHSGACNDPSTLAPSSSLSKTKGIKLERVSSQNVQTLKNNTPAPNSSLLVSNSFQIKGRNQLVKIQNYSSSSEMTNSEITPLRSNLKNQSSNSSINQRIPKSMNSDLKRQSNNMYIRSISKVPYMHTLLPSNAGNSPWTSSSKKNISSKQISAPRIQSFNDQEFSNFIDNNIDSSNNNHNNETTTKTTIIAPSTSYSKLSFSKIEAWNLITCMATSNDSSIDSKAYLAKIREMFTVRAANPSKRRKTLPFNELKRKVTELDPLV